MPFFQSVVLGLIQGLTEFFPISSSAHLVIIPALFHWSQHSTTFDIILHIGTLGALILFEWKDILSLITHIRDKKNQKIILLILCAIIPTGIIGFCFSDFIDINLKGIPIIIFMLIIFGFIYIIVDRLYKNSQKKIQELTFTESFIIGLLQSLSLIRGTSRSGTGIVGGKIFGLSNEESLKFSFLMSIPLIGASGFKEILQYNSGSESYPLLILLGGGITAFITGLVALSIMKNIIPKSGITMWGIYRIVLALLLILTINHI